MRNLKGDIFGGLTAAIVALPISIAFGVQSGLGPEAGLYGAFFVGLIASIVGGTPTQISGPTGPMTVVSTGVVLIFLDKFQGLENALPIILLTFFLAGVIQFIFGIMKIGKYISYIPDPVVSGFMNGIGVIIIAFQLNDFFGTSVDIQTTFTVFGQEVGVSKVVGSFIHLPDMISQANWVAVFLALGTITVIYVFPLLTKVVPSTLVALIIMSFVATFFDPSKVKFINEVSSSLPEFKGGTFFNNNFGFSDILVALGPALTLGTLGIVDSLLTSVVADRVTGTRHNSDKEIIGQGLGNMASALFGGLPGAGSTMRTVTNIKSGGRTKFSGIFTALILMAIILLGGPIVKLIPQPVLAGILITVGISLPDYSSFREMKNIPKQDNIITFVVFALTIFWNILAATAVGLIMAALMFMKKMADIVELGSKGTRTDRLVNQIVDSFEDAEKFKSLVYIKNLKGPVFFGFAFRFKRNMALHDHDKAIIFNLGEVPYMDKSGLITFKDVVADLLKHDVNVCLSEPSEEVEALLRKNKIIPDLIDERHLFESVEECVMWLHEPGHINNVFEADDELYIPSAYTPNGDGINDEWQLRNIEQYPSCVVRITNRDGKEVFFSLGYHEMWEGVNGDHVLPSDVYFYEIDLHNDGSDVRKGTVTIFR